MNAPIADRAPGFVGGNTFDKYRTANPLYRRMMGGFLDACRELLAGVEAGRILEVGCGPGDLAHELLGSVPGFAAARYLGSDVSLEDVAAAARSPLGRPFLGASAYRLPFADASFDCVIACEIFEHLEHPEAALAEVERVASGSPGGGRMGGYLLLSVPWEPVWRLLNLARGRYVKDLGNTPGHVQHFSRGSIRRLVESRFELLGQRCPLPWTVLLARRRGVGGGVSS